MFRKDERHVDQGQKDSFSRIKKEKLHRLGQFSWVGEVGLKKESRAAQAVRKWLEKGRGCIKGSYELSMRILLTEFANTRKGLKLF